MKTATKEISPREEDDKENDDKWAEKISENRSNGRVHNRSDSNTNEIAYKNLAYAMLIPVLSLLTSTGVTMIPQHNIFQHPGYWYEVVIPYATALIPAIVILTAFRVKVWFKEMEFRMTTWIKMFSTNFFVVTIVIFLTRFIWTDYLGYIYPIPWLYFIIVLGWSPFQVMSIYYIFPKGHREDLVARKTIIWFIAYNVVFLMACGERLFVILLFISTPIQFQPIWAIGLPIWKELETRLLNKLMLKTTDDTNRDAKILTNLENTCNHTAVAAITLGIYATDLSSYSILLVDLLSKLYACYGICKMNKKIGNSKEGARKALQKAQMEDTQDLILEELVEVMMPFVYVSMILFAYYGPNSSILGNVGCEKWKWTKITDMTRFLTALFRMFAIDLLALSLNMLILWKFSSVNVTKQLCIDVKKYWPFISVAMGGAVMKVSII